MIVVAGEALIDMVGDQSFRYQAVAGGSCFNVAVALGRLGHEVGFACPISGDALGRLLSGVLAESGVSALMRDDVAAPSPLAVVSVDAAGKPTYAFYRDNTADRTVDADALVAALPASPSLIHVGGISLIPQRDSEQWLAGAVAARERGALVALDANVRPSLIADMDEYRQRLSAFLAITDLLKVSDEDLEALMPDLDTETAFARIVGEYRPAFSVLTLGSRGAIGVTAGGTLVEQKAIAPGPIADTIGAGDSLQAGLISAIHAAGLADRTALAGASEADIGRALLTGTLAAGINCTRKGCNPPWREELDRELASRT